MKWLKNLVRSFSYMLIPSKVLDLFKFNLDEQNSIRTQLAIAEAKVADLERSLQHSRTSFDWLRLRVNDLENQNKALLERNYNIRVPAPQIAPAMTPPIDLREFGFTDVGDELASKFPDLYTNGTE